MHNRFKNKQENEQNETRLELKYCEHCGGLWLRSCGSAEVYCLACRPQVAELPKSTKKPSMRARLPIGPHVTWEESDFDCDIEDLDSADFGVGGIDFRGHVFRDRHQDDVRISDPRIYDPLNDDDDLCSSAGAA